MRMDCSKVQIRFRLFAGSSLGSSDLVSSLLGPPGTYAEHAPSAILPCTNVGLFLPWSKWYLLYNLHELGVSQPRNPVERQVT